MKNKNIKCRYSNAIGETNGDPWCWCTYTSPNPIMPLRLCFTTVSDWRIKFHDTIQSLKRYTVFTFKLIHGLFSDSLICDNKFSLITVTVAFLYQSYPSICVSVRTVCPRNEFEMKQKILKKVKFFMFSVVRDSIWLSSQFI